MPKYNYVAMDAHGKETKGTLEVASQNEAIGRVKEMGLFPTKIVEIEKAKEKPDKKAGPAPKAGAKKAGKKGLQRQPQHQDPRPGRARQIQGPYHFHPPIGDAGRCRVAPVARLARAREAGKESTLKSIIGELAVSIEGGSTFSEGLAQHPKVFNRLFVNMVKAGELGGVLEVVLNRLSEFMEKAQKIKGKVIAAMFYPVAVLIVATGILSILMVYVIPKFKDVFAGMLEGAQLPAFTRLVLGISNMIKDHFIYTAIGIAVFVVIFMIFVRTKIGRYAYDKFKLKVPVVGPVVSKVAISRFTRTLGTLVSSGVPILQALTIVKETAGNVIISNAVGAVHESVKEGETITAPLEASGVFPPMVISMVDVGEQTGALPEMLLKIADNYDEEVDNAVAAMTSLLEPIMIVFLAVIVGSIVIAMFLPLIALMNGIGSEPKGKGDKD